MTVWLDCILAGMAAEAVLLTLLYRRTGRGIAPGALLPNLFAGATLLLAMRLALGGRVVGLGVAGLAGRAWPGISPICGSAGR